MEPLHAPRLRIVTPDAFRGAAMLDVILLALGLGLLGLMAAYAAGCDQV
jgi:hypothetical protein